MTAVLFRLRFWGRTIALALSVLGATSALAESVAITDVNVVDVRTETLLTGRCVHIGGGQIRDIQPAAEECASGADVLIDGRGRYLIPGLWDMHVHLSKARGVALPLLLAHGVTTVRDMGGDFDELLGWRRRIEAGELVGPRILMAGYYLEAQSNVQRMLSENVIEPVRRTRLGIATRAEAREAVATLAERGADFVKVRTVESRDTYFAIADAAKAYDLKLFGHAMDLTPEDVLLAGQSSVEHALWPALINMTSGDLDDAGRRLALANVAITPTLVTWYESLARPVDELAALVEDRPADPLHPRNLLAAYLVEDWKEQTAEREMAPELVDQLRPLVGRMQVVFQQLYSSGVPFFAGTDSAVLGIYPGRSLHDELALLVSELQLTELQALQAATIAPARFMGYERELGVVAVGQVADLVLLNSNPLEDIGNVADIDTVIVRGVVYDRDALNGLMEQARRHPALRTVDWR